MQKALANSSLDASLAEARERFVVRNPASLAAHVEATAAMPGGNTRTVLFHAPFPLTMARGESCRLWDADGHEYVDLLGEYTAGLYGHSNPVIRAAIDSSLDDGWNLGGHGVMEARLARLLVGRFPSLDLVRFTNSGTEANLMALSAARAFTGRERIVVFDGAYHGALLTFAGGGSPINAPYDVVVAPYNDATSAGRLIAEHAGTIAAVLVEPMLGSGGCIPGEPDFLRALRTAADEAGALLIFDEVMTSRIGPGGLQQRLGLTPDLTTLGKYLGGGMSFGAFGGRADVMALFDPTAVGALAHAGTFNNNVASMMAGHAGLTQVYPAEVATLHTARGEALRADLAAVMRRCGAPFQVTGLGSLLNIHPMTGPIRRPADLALGEPRLRELLFLDLLEAGYYMAPRGYLALSLAVTDEQLAGFLESVEDALTARRSLYIP